MPSFTISSIFFSFFFSLLSPLCLPRYPPYIGIYYRPRSILKWCCDWNAMVTDWFRYKGHQLNSFVFIERSSTANAIHNQMQENISLTNSWKPREEKSENEKRVTDEYDVHLISLLVTMEHKFAKRQSLMVVFIIWSHYRNMLIWMRSRMLLEGTADKVVYIRYREDFSRAVLNWLVW